MLRKGSRRRAAHGDRALCRRRKGGIVLKGWNSVYFFVFLFLKPRQKYYLETPFMLHFNYSTNACSCFSMHALVCSHELLIVGATVILSSEFDLSQMEAVPGPLVL